MKMIGKKAGQSRGPGGRDCACCGEPPGKNRKIQKREVKRREKQQWKKEVV